MTEKAQIDFVSNDADFQRAARNVNKALKRTDDNQKKVGRQSRTLWAGMAVTARAAGRALTGVAAAASAAWTAVLGPLALVVGGLAAVAAAVTKFVSAGIKLEQANHNLRQAILRTGDAAESTMRRISKQTEAVADATLKSRAAIRDLTARAVELGIRPEDAARAVQQSLDVAARTRKSVDESLLAIVELAAGQSGAMESLFPKLKAYTDQVERLAAANQEVAASSGAARNQLSNTNRAWAGLRQELVRVAEKFGLAVAPALAEFLKTLRDMDEVWSALSTAAKVLALIMRDLARALEAARTGANFVRGLFGLGRGGQQATVGTGPVQLSTPPMSATPAPATFQPFQRPAYQSGDPTGRQQVNLQGEMVELLRMMLNDGMPARTG